jgi:hypothetical protein
MKADEAARVLEGMRYRPGATTLAVPVDDDNVMFAVLFEDGAYESTPGPDGSNDKISLFSTPPVKIRCRSLDKLGVQAAGLNGIIEFELHEAREFWREQSGDMKAPFHPHNRSGEANWQRTRAIPVEVEYPEPDGD